MRDGYTFSMARHSRRSCVRISPETNYAERYDVRWRDPSNTHPAQQTPQLDARKPLLPTNSKMPRIPRQPATTYKTHFSAANPNELPALRFPHSFARLAQWLKSRVRREITHCG